MPWLTPDNVPEESACRSLLIPADSVWLALVSGALTELTQKWNWQKFGTLTVDETVAVFRSMIDAYYAGCAACTQPGGYKVIRIGIGGRVEELNGDGDYVPATGDYEVAPIPARTGGTSQDQICLAAANAENVLHEVYNNLAASFASELTQAEALTALVEFLIINIGAEFAPITYALALLFLGIFALVYSALSYLTADLWDSNFTEAFKCMLVGCASNDAGVVTFDWDCVEHALYAAATTFGIDEVQLRLYAQINYILSFIGGSDALNTAGANTGITSADCSDCACSCTEFTWDIAVSGAGEFWHFFTGSFNGTDAIVQSCYGGLGTPTSFNFGFLIGNGTPFHVTHVSMDIAVTGSPTDWYWYGLIAANPITPAGQVLLASGTTSGGTVSADSADMDTLFYGFQLITYTTAGCGSSDAHLTEFTFESPDLCAVNLC